MSNAAHAPQPDTARNTTVVEQYWIYGLMVTRAHYPPWGAGGHQKGLILGFGLELGDLGEGSWKQALPLIGCC